MLREHPAVLDAAVIGIDHPKLGEVPKAFVVPKGSKEVIDANEIMAFVAERVAPYKKIRDVMFIEEVPKTNSGKILRRLLKEKYC